LVLVVLAVYQVVQSPLGTALVVVVVVTHEKIT
jgi:hypothetical protein